MGDLAITTDKKMARSARPPEGNLASRRDRIGETDACRRPRRSAGPQRRGGSAVEAAVGGEGDPIVARCGLARKGTVGIVESDLSAGSPKPPPPSTASRPSPHGIRTGGKIAVLNGAISGGALPASAPNSSSSPSATAIDLRDPQGRAPSS